MEKPLNILLIEDNPGDAFLVKFYLEESIFKNTRLIHAEFLKTGLDLLSKNAFDVILLDLNLPDSKGIDTLTQILGIVVDSVVIVLTGLQDEELGVQTVKMGAQDFMVKGQFDGKVLASSVRYAFERYQLQKTVDSYNDELNENKEQFLAAQEILNMGYWELDLNDKNMHWSSHLFNLLHVKASEKAATLPYLLTLLEPNDADKLNALLLKASEKGEPFAHNFHLLNGKQQLVCRARPHKNDLGITTKIVGTVQAIS